MFPYLLVFFLFTFFSLIEALRPKDNYAQIHHTSGTKFLLTFLGILLWLFIGIRYEVGGDWGNYLFYYNNTYILSNNLIWWLDDPGYRFLEWISYKLNGGILLVNLFAASFFSIGLIQLCSKFNRPILALTIAIPYLVIVVAMGYTRQACAIGIMMYGLSKWNGRSTAVILRYTIIAALFHKSAIIFFALALIRVTLISKIFLGGMLFVAFFYVNIFSSASEAINKNYIQAEYNSSGALIRLSMNALASIIYLIFWNISFKRIFLANIWFLFSIASLFILFLYFMTPSSTLLDRISLYLIPIQSVAFSSLPQLINPKQHFLRLMLTSLILAYAFLTLFIWLNFATHSSSWIPYKIFPL